MTPDNSNLSSLFGDIQPNPPTPPAPVVPEVASNDLSGAISEGIFSTIQSSMPPVTSAPTIASSIPSITTTPPEIPVDTAPLAPAASRVSEVMAASLPSLEVPEVVAHEPVAPMTPSVPDNSEEGRKLREYMEQDVIYQSMLRITDPEKIRLRLAMRYLIMMFAIFLVVAWVVNNRIIMFGFSEFQWLARIRDGLFGLLAGLFSVTIWFGSDVWFRSKFFVFFFRFLALGFFAAILSALYFPLW